MKTTRAVFLSCITMLVACAPQVTDDYESGGDLTAQSRTDELLSGTTDTGDTAVQQLVFKFLGGGIAYRCSMVKIATRTFLTSAECIGRSVLNPGPVELTVSGVTYNPSSFITDPLFTGVIGKWEPALVTFAVDPPVPTMPIHQTNLGPQHYTSATTAVRLVGFGASVAGGAQGTRLQKTMTINSIVGNNIKVGGAVCSGDEGAPAFMTINGVEGIVGVATQGNCSSTSDIAQISLSLPWLRTATPFAATYLNRSRAWISARSARSRTANFSASTHAEFITFTGPTSTWFYRNDLGNTATVTHGADGDFPVVGDWDGNGRSDYGTWRRTNGTWYFRNSQTGVQTTKVLGQNGDFPVPGDYDGDGKTDAAVWRPSTGTWFISQSSNGATVQVVLGVSGDEPQPADYDGDGKTDLAVYRWSNFNWIIRNSSNLVTNTTVFGAAGDLPVPADYDNDGKVDRAVYTPSTATWKMAMSLLGNINQVFGAVDDIPVSDDYDGNGVLDLGVFRPRTGEWIFKLDITGGTSTFSGFSQPGAITAQ